MSAELIEEDLSDLEGIELEEEPDPPYTFRPSTSNDAFLRPDDPVEIEGRNPRRRHRYSETVGDVWIIEYEVDELTWRAWSVIPRTAAVTAVTWWNDGDAPDKPVKRLKAAKEQKQLGTSKKPKVPKGANGALWNSLVKRGFWDFPGVRESLALKESQGQKEALAAMRNEFNTDTLATIAASEVAAWANARGLDRFMDLVRQVQANLEGRIKKAS